MTAPFDSTESEPATRPTPRPSPRAWPCRLRSSVPRLDPEQCACQAELLLLARKIRVFRTRACHDRTAPGLSDEIRAARAARHTDLGNGRDRNSLVSSTRGHPPAR